MVSFGDMRGHVRSLYKEWFPPTPPPEPSAPPTTAETTIPVPDAPPGLEAYLEEDIINGGWKVRYRPPEPEPLPEGLSQERREELIVERQKLQRLFETQRELLEWQHKQQINLPIEQDKALRAHLKEEEKAAKEKLLNKKWKDLFKQELRECGKDFGVSFSSEQGWPEATLNFFRPMLPAPPLTMSAALVCGTAYSYESSSWVADKLVEWGAWFAGGAFYRLPVLVQTISAFVGYEFFRNKAVQMLSSPQSFSAHERPSLAIDPKRVVIGSLVLATVLNNRAGYAAVTAFANPITLGTVGMCAAADYAQVMRTEGTFIPRSLRPVAQIAIDAGSSVSEKLDTLYQIATDGKLTRFANDSLETTGKYASELYNQITPNRMSQAVTAGATLGALSMSVRYVAENYGAPLPWHSPFERSTSYASSMAELLHKNVLPYLPSNSTIALGAVALATGYAATQIFSPPTEEVKN